MFVQMSLRFDCTALRASPLTTVPMLFRERERLAMAYYFDYRVPQMNFVI